MPKTKAFFCYLTLPVQRWCLHRICMKWNRIRSALLMLISRRGRLICYTAASHSLNSFFFLLAFHQMTVRIMRWFFFFFKLTFFFFVCLSFELFIFHCAWCFMLMPVWVLMRDMFPIKKFMISHFVHDFYYTCTEVEKREWEVEFSRAYSQGLFDVHFDGFLREIYIITITQFPKCVIISTLLCWRLKFMAY